jgi:protein gp37
MGKTDIQWASDTLNPVRGCFPVSPGCANCFAMRLAATRLRNHPKYKGLATYDYDGRPRWTGEVQLDIDVMREVLSWRKPRTCFLCDMSDLFYEKVPDDFIDQVLAYCAIAHRHRFYILTKRATRMREYFSLRERWDRINDAWGDGRCAAIGKLDPWPLPNVWLGVSVEDQERADERIPDLLATPAAMRFVSYEPALGPIDCSDQFARYREIGTALLPAPDWFIVGAESGPGARPSQPDWARSVRDQCAGADVPFYLKQWNRSEGVVSGTGTTGTLISLPVLDGVQHKDYPERTP